MSRLHLNNNSNIHSYKDSLGSQKQLYIYHVLASVGVWQQKKDIGTTYFEIIWKEYEETSSGFPIIIRGYSNTPTINSNIL